VEPKNWGRLKRKPDIWTDLARKNIDSDKAWTLVRGIQEIMPKWASESWRWRIIWIRARLDYLLNENSNEPDEECEALFCELVELYHLDIHNSYRATIPYTDQWLRLPKLNLREKSSSKTDGKVDWG
jgi:hypothetical protein